MTDTKGTALFDQAAGMAICHVTCLNVSNRPACLLAACIAWAAAALLLEAQCMR